MADRQALAVPVSFAGYARDAWMPMDDRTCPRSCTAMGLFRMS